MGAVLLVNLEPDTAEQLFAVQPMPEVRNLDDPEKVRQELARRSRAVDLLVLGANAGDPVRLAEDVRGVDEDLSIVILAKPAELERIERKVMFAPFLSGDVTCQSLSDNRTVRRVLDEARARTQQRRKHHDDVAATLLKLEATKVWRPNPTQYLDRLLDHAPIGIAVLDYSGEIREWNRRAEAIFDAPKEDILESRLTDLFHASDRDDVENFIARSMTNGDGPSPKVFRAYGAGGSNIRQLEVTAAAVSSESDEPGALVLFKDITREMEQREERERIETQMQRAQKLESLGVLAGGIAHDFNNLLVSIVGNADLALLLADSGSPIQKSLIKIKLAGGRASELTQQLLVYSGKNEVRTETIEINPLVSELRNLLEVSISDYVSVDMMLSSDLPAVRGDLSQIGQVLMNLVTNASEAIGEQPGRMTIATGTVELTPEKCAELNTTWEVSEGDYVFIDVSDTGCGMNEATREQMLEPFFTTKFTGRGLGLAAVAGIVRSHHGALEVQSELGAGTTFRVLLPAAPCARSNETPSRSARPLDSARGEGTILAVDDEDDVRDVLSDMLETLGFQVETARDGIEALEIFEKSPQSFRAVILDLAMPRMGGAETLRALRAVRPDIPVIVCTGYGQDQNLEGTDPTAFLQKPFKLSNLVEEIERAIGAV